MKQWLKDNKIYFETAAAALLSTMAIIVSVAQLSISSAQNELAAAQLVVAREQIQPVISVTAHQLYDEQKEFVTDDEIRITNVGAPVFEVDSEYSTDLAVTLLSRNSIHSTEVTLALGGYYVGTGVSQSSSGQLRTIKGHRNNSKLFKLQKEFRELAEQKGFFGKLTLIRTVRVSYRNSLSEFFDRYFHVNIVAGATSITVEEGKTRFELNRGKFGTELFQEFDSLDANMLFELAMRNYDVAA